jgi:hypothetical protein
MEQQPLHTSEVKPLAATQPPHTSETKQLAATPQPLHRDDADDDDENVKQLDECSIRIGNILSNNFCIE